MKVLLVGAGGQGGPCASILARDNDVSEIVLADINLEAAKQVAARVRGDKIAPVKVDAGNVNEVVRAAKGADVIINLLPPDCNQNIMEAAQRSGVHYVDTSTGNFLLGQIMENRPLPFDKEFKDAGLTALFDCGHVPGISNLVARFLCDKLDTVDKVRILLGIRIMNPSKEIASGWTTAWSPAGNLSVMAREPITYEDGQYKKYPIFTSPEEYTFPAPVGRILLTLRGHPEAITLPHFIGKGMKTCEFKHPVDPLVGAFVKMGFASPEAIDVKGVKVVPKDVLLKLVPPPVNGFLAEDETSSSQPPQFQPTALSEVMCTLVEAYGTQSGEKVQYTAWHFHGPNAMAGLAPEERINAYRRLGTNLGDVAFPAVVGAKLCVRGAADKGVIFPECLDPKVFFGTMAEMGAPMRLHETVSRVLK